MSDEVTNEYIIELSKLNNILNLDNKESNVKLVFAGFKDERDPIIDKIMIVEDVYTFCEKQSYEMNEYYLKVYKNDICFSDIVDKIVRILLKKFILFNDTQKPKAYMLSYCFEKGFGTFPNRVWGYFNRYYPNYFSEMKSHKSLDKMIENQSRLDIDEKDYFESNNFYIDFHENAIDRKDYRSRIGNKGIFNDDSEIMDLDNVEEDEEAWDTEDIDLLLDSESHPTMKNTVITSYDIPYQKCRANNKYIALSDEEYDKEINRIRKVKLKKWYAYKNDSGMLPHDVTKFKEGDNYFKVRNNKNPDYIHVICRLGKYSNKILFDKNIESYLLNIIIKNLSERQQLLVGYLYYQMILVDDVVSLMGFSNKTALDKEKSRCLSKIRCQILKDYEFILEEYDDTFLAYWIKKIKQDEEYAKKEEKKLSI